MKTFMTLCIVHEGDRVLLGYKKRGFGAGRWNGFGGKVKAGESIEDATRREMQEECGVVVGLLEKAGVLTFSFEHDDSELEMHIYRATEFTGTPKESEEMRPEWFHTNAIPFADMWPDDPYWFPYFIAKKSFRGRFHFQKDTANQAAGSDSILAMELHEIADL